MITSIELYLKDYKETCFPLKTACHLPPKILSRQQARKHATTSHSIRCSVRKTRQLMLFTWVAWGRKHEEFVVVRCENRSRASR